MYKPVPVEGQFFTNRVRKNVFKIMEARGMAGSQGLPRMSPAGLYKFMSGGADITLTRAQLIADDLGVSLHELLSYAD